MMWRRLHRKTEKAGLFSTRMPASDFERHFHFYICCSWNNIRIQSSSKKTWRPRSSREDRREKQDSAKNMKMSGGPCPSPGSDGRKRDADLWPRHEETEVGGGRARALTGALSTCSGARCFFIVSTFDVHNSEKKTGFFFKIWSDRKPYTFPFARLTDSQLFHGKLLLNSAWLDLTREVTLLHFGF